MRNEPRQSSGVRALVLWIGGVMAAAIASYALSLGGGFVLDDEALIVADQRAHSLASLPSILLRRFVPNVLGVEIEYYRPVITASYQANYMMAGTHAFVFRLTNLLLHVLVAVLVFLFARRLTRSMTTAGIAAILFACLPPHAEAVAWISGRTDVISTLFVLAAMIAFVVARSRQAFGWPLAVTCGVCWFLALLSKESAVVLPLLMAGYAWVYPKPPSEVAMEAAKLPESREAPRDVRGEWKWRAAVKWIVALIVPFAIYLVLRHQVVRATVVSNITFMLGQRLLGVGIAYVSYLGMIFLPRTGHVVYDVFPIGMKYPLVALSAWLVPVAMVVAVIWLRKRAPVVSYSLLWVLVSLLPVVNILPASSQVPSERFVYLPSVGSCVILGWLAWRMLEYRPRQVRAWPVLAAIVVCWFVLYCWALTVQTAQSYYSNLTWARAVSRENKRFFHAWAGYYFAEAGLLREAVREYQAAIVHEKRPDYSYAELGRLLCELGEPAKAVRVLREGARRFPEVAVIEFRLGVANAGIGDFASAASAFQRATRLDTKYASAWRNLGKANLKLRRYPAAAAAYKRAFSLVEPTDADRRDYDRARQAAGMSRQ